MDPFVNNSVLIHALACFIIETMTTQLTEAHMTHQASMNEILQRTDAYPCT